MFSIVFSTVFNSHNGIKTRKVQIYSVMKIKINNDLDKHIQAKTSDKKSPTFRRHLGAIVKENWIKVIPE